MQEYCKGALDFNEGERKHAEDEQTLNDPILVGKDAGEHVFM